MSIFNTCIITTSSEKQAEIYRKLIKRRIDHGLYPSLIDFHVYSDPSAGSVGSGGATVLALKRYFEQPAFSDLRDEKILIIHAGKRDFQVPFFSSEGILFTPLPLSSSSIISPTVLDLHLSLFLKYPWNSGEVVVISADVIVDFDTSEVKENRGDICGFAVRAPLARAVSHGVFKFDSYRSRIINYFQKADYHFLQSNALLEGTGECAVDMGIVSFSKNFVSALLDVSSSKTSRETALLDLLQTGSVSFSLYLELITATLLGMEYQPFLSRVSEKSEMPEELLSLFFECLSRFDLKAQLARSATFLPLSTIPDYFQSCLELRRKELPVFYARDFQELAVDGAANLTVFNSSRFTLPLGNHKPVIGESVRNCTLENVLGNNIFTGIDNWSSDITIPEGICIDQRMLSEGSVKIAVGMEDTFKADTVYDQIIFCGMPLGRWLEERNLTPEDLWEESEKRNLINARLFIKDCSGEFLSGYWTKFPGGHWSRAFRSAYRYSIGELNGLADGAARDELRTEIRRSLLRKQIISGRGWITCSVNDFSSVFSDNPPIGKLSEIYDSTADYLLKLYRNRLMEEISSGMAGEEISGFHVSEKKASGFFCYVNQGPGLDKTVSAQCPVRIDIAGGWTDMPPFTLRHGGAVVNFSADLNGKPPVQVFCRKTTDPLIRLISIDKGIWETVTEFGQLDPETGSSAFTLHKLVLSESGFGKGFNKECSSLSDLLKRLGFGVELTSFCSVPPGSGLGASSTLASTLLAALYRLLGKEFQISDQISAIIGLEQRLRAGGGWQDLLGAATGGLKYIESRPGLIPDPLIYHLDSSFIASNFDLFTLYYSGIQRQSNLVMAEAGRKMSAHIPSFDFILHYLKQLAKDARTAIETNNLHNLVNIIDSGRKAGGLMFVEKENSALKILQETAAFYNSALKFTGAGGGGYALFLSPDKEKAAALREHLNGNNGNGAAIVPFSLNRSGLEITIM